MAQFINALNLSQLSPDETRRIIFACFCLFTFIILFYFYRLSLARKSALRENVSGLKFMALTFLFYFILGCTSVLSQNLALVIIFSGCINICLLLSIPFFKRGGSPLDNWAVKSHWKYVAILFGLIYVVQGVLNRPMQEKLIIDSISSSVSIIGVGIFVSWDFVRRNLVLIAVLIGLSIGGLLLLQFFAQPLLGGHKFIHINTVILSAGLIESIVALAITFNWISELRFREVTRIYSDEHGDTVSQDYFDKRITKDALKSAWRDLVAKDDLEKLIEGMMVVFERRNKSLEILLNVAARNTRNNTSQMKDEISTEEYNVSRNKITSTLLTLIEDF